MKLGTKSYQYEWCYGIEISRTTPTREGFHPRLEVWCYKLDKRPRGRALEKTDYKGFWKIIWLDHQKTVRVNRILRRKGFRDQAQTLERKGKWKLMIW
jgi:hypothetical protein